MFGAALYLGLDVELGWTSGNAHLVVEQMVCAVAGYLLKDFVVYDDGLDSAYIAHHVCLNVVTLSVVLTFPCTDLWSHRLWNILPFPLGRWALVLQHGPS